MGWEPCATALPGINAVEVSDTARIDSEHGDESDRDSSNDGLSDWFGYPSSVDHLCGGWREAVLGTAWIDEAAYLKPPLSLLQAALSGRAVRSREDPGCKQLLRLQLEYPHEGLDNEEVWQDELHDT